MIMNPEKIIVFGGSFDPIHNSHITLCKNSLKEVGADKLILVPSKNPRWKIPTETIEDRLNMINLCLKDYGLDYEIEDCEIKSWKEVDYTIETIEHLKKKHPNAKLYLLIGADQVNKFDRWREAEKIAEATQIIYYPRPGYIINEKLVSRYNMIKISGNLVDTSSTKIRALNSLDTSISVINYIIENKLYFMDKIDNYLSGRRLEHSISVANLAFKVATSNNLPFPGTYYLTGLIHDIGKNIAKEEQRDYIEKYYRYYTDIPEYAYHQFVGSAIALKEFGITDKTILKAIKYHCTGNKEMSDLGKVIYACDKIEPTRGYDSSDLIESMLNNYESGFIKVLEENMKFISSRTNDHNPYTDELTQICASYYLYGLDYR